MSEKVLCVQCRKCHNTTPLIGCGTHCPHCNALMVVANLVSAAKEEEGRKERRHKIASAISRLTPYLIGVLWLVEAVINLIEKSDDWMLISIIGSIWILIGSVSSK